MGSASRVTQATFFCCLGPKDRRDCLGRTIQVFPLNLRFFENVPKIMFFATRAGKTQDIDLWQQNGFRPGVINGVIVQNNPVNAVDPLGLCGLQEDYLGDALTFVGSAAVVVGAEALAAGESIEEAMVSLFRAVGPDELASIEETGSFSSPYGLEGKYFTTSAEEAASYAQQAVNAFGDPPYTIVQTEVPHSVLNTPGISATVDGGITAYQIPNEMLPQMQPQILNYSPLP